MPGPRPFDGRFPALGDEALLCDEALIARLRAALDLLDRPLDADESTEPAAPLPLNALQRFAEISLVGGDDGARDGLELLGDVAIADHHVRKRARGGLGDG